MTLRRCAGAISSKICSVGGSRDAEKPPSIYDGATLHVRSYDSRPVLSGDAQFYLGLARRAGGGVLEIGVGSGRIALQLVDAEVYVTGLELAGYAGGRE
jgi:hypothetical protein